MTSVKPSERLHMALRLLETRQTRPVRRLGKLTTSHLARLQGLPDGTCCATSYIQPSDAWTLGMAA